MNQIAPSLSPTTRHSSAVVSASSSSASSSSPDVRLGTQVRKALDSSGYASLSALECQVDDGVVTLSGEVSSYYLKQVAQEAVRRLGTADRIENQVKVVYS